MRGLCKIHSSSISLILCTRSRGASGDFGHKAGYILDRVPVGRRTHAHTHTLFGKAIKPNLHVLEPSTLEMQFDSADHYATMLADFVTIGSKSIPSSFPTWESLQERRLSCFSVICQACFSLINFVREKQQRFMRKQLL